jgi:hypothetical protein
VFSTAFALDICLQKRESSKNSERETYPTSRLEDFPNRSHDALDIPALVEEAQAFAERDLAHDVKGKQLKPGTEVDCAAADTRSHFVDALQEELNRRVDVRLELDEVAHRVHGGNGPLHGAVQRFILGVEEAVYSLTPYHRLQGLVEIGLLAK